ncbi:DEAD/DEAH box helicase [Bacteroides sp. OttesenSCG-928-E20]|nr:DEAD/DEAH box helicase [Bacteroides sp. OttesenSCG-928-N06]MDL2299156.1 DEAD/DEAH box helicase [Bacteroides sp. OttesenSCG-928-E20]MDL2304643.1 DEAD/DEAH box helicase [Bacteroides sp. OttesenSCG-928-D19]
MAKKFVFTQGQERAFLKMMSFVDAPNKRVFILKGYAGTGKTTLMKLLVEELRKLNKRFHLLASTGRAAKVLSNITDSEATTVHGLIYTFHDLNQDLEQLVSERERTGIDKSEQLLLNFKLNTVDRITDTSKCIYIIDEASMISDKVDNNATQAAFGSGRLLKDLLDYDTEGKFIFVGDICQLPPIIQNISPALSVDYFRKNHQMDAEEVELTDIVRQQSGNDIVMASKKIRDLYFKCPDIKWAQFPLKKYQHIHLFPDQMSLIRSYKERIKKNGYANATLICRSNKSCDVLTDMLRPSFGLHSSRLQKGDLLLITQNNLISGFMNGDLVTVEEIIEERIVRANLTFVQVKVKDLNSERVYSQLLIEDILNGAQTNLTASQQSELYIDFFLRMRKKGIKQRSELFKENMMNDVYLNALRAVYGYALTCHKAQGGEWDHVYLDIPRKIAFNPKQEVYQWLYTAMTRAKTELYLIDDFYII